MENRNLPCPMNPESVDAMTETLKNIDQRLQKIERMMFAGRVALTVIMGCVAAAWWVIDHAESIRHGIINWLKS